MSVFIVLCLIALQSFHTGLSLDLLDPPHTIRGTVWEDWNGDGVHQSYEPGFAHATVHLLYQPDDETNFLLNDDSNVISSMTFFTGSDGQYYFSCLTNGNYSIQITLPESRPSTFSPSTSDSDITIVNGQVGSTDFFEATAATLTTIDVGVVQYGFMNLFPMTGRENVPTEPDTVLGTTYSVFDARTNKLYYRVERGEFKQYDHEDKAGFFRGYPGTNGDQVRSLADRSAVKTNAWVVPTTEVPNLLNGKMYVLIHGNGSFSDNSRLRGNWNPFHNSKNVQTSLTLLGENVVPAVATSATGSLHISFNFDSTVFNYELMLDGIDRSQDFSVELYGPADVGTTGNKLGVFLTEGKHTAIVPPGFNLTFFSSKVYVQLTTPQYPNGLLRAQISGFSQSVFSTSSYVSEFGTAESYIKIALSLDTVKHTLSYYVTIQAPADATHISLAFTLPLVLDEVIPVTYNKAGLWVAQGFFWNLSPNDEQMILTSKSQVFGDSFAIVADVEGPAFFGYDYLYPLNWY